MIKKKMIDSGRDDFVNYLAEILEISRQSASRKISGQSKFTVDDLRKLEKRLKFSPDEIKDIIGADQCDG